MGLAALQPRAYRVTTVRDAADSCPEDLIERDFTATAPGMRLVGDITYLHTGVCWDNAAAESFFATLKNEIYHRYRFDTRARARFAVAEYIELFYNRRPKHSTLGYRTPAQALNDYQQQAATSV